MTHRRDVTFCVSICMLNLLSLSLSPRLLNQAVYISHPRPLIVSLSPSPLLSLFSCSTAFAASPFNESFSRICFTGVFDHSPELLVRTLSREKIFPPLLSSSFDRGRLLSCRAGVHGCLQVGYYVSLRCDRRSNLMFKQNLCLKYILFCGVCVCQLYFR